MCNSGEAPMRGRTPGRRDEDYCGMHKINTQDLKQQGEDIHDIKETLQTQNEVLIAQSNALSNHKGQMTMLKFGLPIFLTLFSIVVATWLWVQDRRDADKVELLEKQVEITEKLAEQTNKINLDFRTYQADHRQSASYEVQRIDKNEKATAENTLAIHVLQDEIRELRHVIMQMKGTK